MEFHALGWSQFFCFSKTTIIFCKRIENLTNFLLCLKRPHRIDDSHSRDQDKEDSQGSNRNKLSRKRLNMSYSSLIGEKAKVASFFAKNADVGLDGLQFLTQIGNVDPDNRLVYIFLILPDGLKKVLSR